MVEKLVTWMYKVALKKSSCVFFQNSYNKQILEEKGIFGQRSRLVPGSGVNLEQHTAESYPMKGKPEFLYVGRIMKEKGMDEMFEAAKIYHDRADFSILGYTEEAYEAEMESLSKAGIIKYYGFDTDVHKYMTKASAILMPSYHEGMSNVILEAAACARPVLASNISGCKEGVEDSRTGYLFAAKSASSLMSAVEQFLALDVRERADMGIRGRQKMEQEFDRQKVVNAYVEEIESIKY